MKDDPLALENRQALYEFIQLNPGSHMRRISRELDMKMGTLRHHLRQLEKMRKIISRREKNLKIFFVAGKLDTEDRIISPLLQQKRFRDIMLVLLNKPNATQTTIARELSLKTSTLSNYMRVLVDRGIVTYQKVENEKRCHLVDERKIIRLLKAYRWSFWDSFVDNALTMYYERE